MFMNKLFLAVTLRSTGANNIIHCVVCVLSCPMSGGLCISPGPTCHFRRVCEKLQAGIVNPSTVNPLVNEMADFGLNPSLSSDDTLANDSEEPTLVERNGERPARDLLESYDSTEDEGEEAPTSILN